ncbi:MAG: SDR family oxidoreductase [Alphaproteobacteria bacterium]|jgi:3-oxoacyl-[acyl-carrier protein] reductase|nr:SDR family oxidoreductase [Alphaproteobacteria bacterium]
MTDGEFAGRTALVTGAARGIGRAICLRLATSGARVAVNYATSEAAATQTCEDIRALGCEAAAYRADVSDEAETDAMFGRIEAELGPVDLLVTNAGIASAADTPEMGADVWNEILRVNLNGTFHPVWRAKDSMQERGFGRIVCVSSIAGLIPNPATRGRLIAYGTSKAAIIAFVRNCADVMGPELRLNCVAPGYIDTDMTAGISDEMKARLMERTPLGRIGNVEEVAELAHFLLSEASSFTTGQTYVADGGVAMLP